MKTEHKIDGIPISKYWINKARKHLEGAKFWMYPTVDEEGNDGGALFTTIKDYQCACRL